MTVDAQIGGKLAQLGQRLVNGAAKKVADDFFENFAKAVNPTSPLKATARQRGGLSMDPAMTLLWAGMALSVAAKVRPVAGSNEWNRAAQIAALVAGRS